ncbi:hypothetical protein GCM10028805_60550 [Spirosoma harenae]
MEGKLEAKIPSIDFEQCIMFMPGLIGKFRLVSTAILAEKLAKAPKLLPIGIHVVELNKISGY